MEAVTHLRQRGSDHQQWARRATVAAAAAFAFTVVVVAVASQQQGRSALSVSFSDGPDPDAPAVTDLWNNGLAGLQERGQGGGDEHQANDQGQQEKLVSVGDSNYQYSQSGYAVKRLERTVGKIKSAEEEFAEIDRQRDEVMRQVKELEQRAAGLALQAKDVKEDLTRYSKQQRKLVNQLHVNTKGSGGEDKKQPKESAGEEPTSAVPAAAEGGGAAGSASAEPATVEATVEPVTENATAEPAA